MFLFELKRLVTYEILHTNDISPNFFFRNDTNLTTIEVQSGHCQITPSNIITNCSFLSTTYLSNSAVVDQIQFSNPTSITLTASYSFISSSTFELGLIYQFPTSNSLVPFPVIFDCASIVRSCQLKPITSGDSEPIIVQLTSFNYTTRTSILFNQMGLYLKQGRYQLSNCSLNQGEQMIDPQRIFSIQIQYEKSLGTSCDSTHDICGSPSLTTCSSSICTCQTSFSSIVSYSGAFYCADMLNISDCQIFPSRCITWCNQTRNYLCICPSDTVKIQRNNFFICELPINSTNCSINDDQLRRCSLGQCCFNGQCLDCSITTTTKGINLNNSLDESLRIALGVITGLLGTAVLILLGAFCWLHQRQKRRRIAAEKTLTNSSTSSLYITPIQQRQQIKVPSSISHFPPFHRTDSFRQAVLSSHQSSKIFEHVSTKRDSYPYAQNGWSSPTFSSLEYIIPSEDFNKEKNIYQIILPVTPNLTHTV